MNYVDADVRGSTDIDDMAVNDASLAFPVKHHFALRLSLGTGFDIYEVDTFGNVDTPQA